MANDIDIIFCSHINLKNILLNKSYIDIQSKIKTYLLTRNYQLYNKDLLNSIDKILIETDFINNIS